MISGTFQGVGRKRGSELADTKRVYAFGGGHTEGDKSMKFILGGKGANLAEMANMGLPVPPGFTISCQACMEYYNATPPAFPEGLAEEVASHVAALEAKMARTLGDDNDPLLVSVRSGSAFSMPGMMDTVLNLGLNDRSVQGLIAKSGNERFAWDSYRRFIQMFSKVVLDVEGDLFENAITSMILSRGVKVDTELTAADMRELVGTFKDIVAEHVSTGEYPSLAVDGKVAFPQDPTMQLRLAIEAVFRSWMNDRAVLYRKMERIADDLGTAVNVQAMVFGNMGETSGTGVGFTRNAADGTKEFYGDFLTNAQGEDVVAGIRQTRPIAELPDVLPEAGNELYGVFDILEKAYRDMCDIEFTIQEGKLWMLQTRIGKRTARAALKIAVDMVAEGMITREEAVLRINPAQLDQLMHPQFDTKAKYDVLAKGLNASPGAAVGEVVFSANDAVEAAAEGRSVIFGLDLTGKNIAFVLDVSGSMTTTDPLPLDGGPRPRSVTRKDGVIIDESRERIFRAKEELVRVIRDLPDDKSFNIIAYSSDVKPWKENLVPADAARKRQAIDFIESLRAEGITVTDMALEYAFEDPIVDTIYLITDGAPTHQGSVGPGLPADAPRLIAEILARAKVLNFRRGVRIFTLGFPGAEEDFLKKLSQEHNGKYRPIR